MNWDKLDDVTIKDIRLTLEGDLEGHLDTFNKLIRQGYSQIHQAQGHLEKAIIPKLTQLQNLHAWADREAIKKMGKIK